MISLFIRAYNKHWVKIPRRRQIISIVRFFTANYKERGMAINGNVKLVKRICSAVQ